MRLIRKLNILAFMTALAVGPIACGDDEGNMTTDGGGDGSMNNPDGSMNNPDGSMNNPDSSNNPDGSNTGSCESGGETFSYFISALDIGQEDTEGEIAGLNIDGQDNTGSTVTYSSNEDGRPCQERPDFKLPGGSAMGIDNSVGKLLTDLKEEVPQIDLDLSAELANSIKNGTLMLAVRIHNVDLEAGSFPQNDDCVNAEILRLQVPEGWDGTAEPNDEFEVHPMSYDSDTGEAVVRFLRAKIVNGRMVGESVSTLPVGFDGADEFVQLGLIDAELDVAVDGDTITGGLLGSRIEVEGLADQIIKYDPNMLSSYKPVLEQLLANYADLNPVDPQTGAVCQNISIGISYSGVAATLTDPL